MRFRLAALFLCLAVTPVMAKPSPVTQFSGDRYSLMLAQGMSGEDMARVMRCPAPLARDCRVPSKAKKKLHRHERAKVAARSGAVIVPLPRVRPEMDEDQAAAYRVIADLLAGGKVYVRPVALPAPAMPPVRQTLLGGLAREIGRALPKGRPLTGIVKPLAAKVMQIASACPGTVVISTIRHGAVVRGSGRPSLHRYGKAVDISGPYRCIYLALRGFPGGYSTDAHRVRHVHISFDPKGREWGRRFAHCRPGKRRTRYARHHHKHYASAR
jgi:hypothetical protein